MQIVRVRSLLRQLFPKTKHPRPGDPWEHRVAAETQRLIGEGVSPFDARKLAIQALSKQESAGRPRKRRPKRTFKVF